MDAGFARFLSFSAARQWLARVNLVLFGPAILRKCPFAIVERCVMVSFVDRNNDLIAICYSLHRAKRLHIRLQQSFLLLWISARSPPHRSHRLLIEHQRFSLQSANNLST
jgi:hypothetical protein